MIRYFSLRPTPEDGRHASVPPQRSRPTAEPAACDSYEPGHLMHYVTQGQALRSASVRAVNVLVDDQLLLVDLEDGRSLEWHHHDPVRLRSVLHLFPGARVAYLEHVALRLGPYWFNCSSEPLTPCALTAGTATP